jgi:ribosomal protein L11 methyltransferase
MRLFFASADARDAACAELRARGFETAVLDVSDDDWARRSQDNLQPVTVGRITVIPAAGLKSRATGAAHATGGSNATGGQPRRTSHEPPIEIVIPASMAFGTGHHATTRLCLDALQRLDLAGCSVLDVGTGSGILAIAADRLGAAAVTGIDDDSDAIHAARENLTLNPEVTHVAFELAELSARPLVPVDVVTANLAGSLLVRSAAVLVDAVRRGGSLVLSGILAEERDDVARAFGDGTIVWQQQDGEWMGLVVRRT